MNHEELESLLQFSSEQISFSPLSAPPASAQVKGHLQKSLRKGTSIFWFLLSVFKATTPQRLTPPGATAPSKLCAPFANLLSNHKHITSVSVCASTFHTPYPLLTEVTGG